MKFFISVLLISFITNSVQYDDEFNEELFIKPLLSGHINTYFQFTTKWNHNINDDLHHTNLFPRAIADIFLSYNIRELHLSLTHGLWRHETWGYPVTEGPPGAEIWAWFDNNYNDIELVNIKHLIDEQWKNLCGKLSGLFCASLSFIEEANTFSPEYTFRPQFNILNSNNNISSIYIRYATLPREIVCTENLTPWNKLLPCHHREGFTSLLNSDHIYGTNYHSLGLHIRSLCDFNVNNIKLCNYEVKQTVNLVFDPLLFGAKDEWSIRKLFGLGLNGACTLSKSSKIYLDITDQNYTLIPLPDREFITKRGGAESSIVEYDIQRLPKGKLFNLVAIKRNTNMINNLPIIITPPLYAKRLLLGIGQERGKIVTKITNMHWSVLNIIIQENIPWFVPIYLHTLKITYGNGKTIEPQIIKYIPGKQRERPYHLEIGCKIPSRTTIEVSINFDYIFLTWLEYPPDAHHGHYIGSAIISAVLPIARNYTSIPIDGSLFADSFNATRSGYLVQIRTETILLSLPTPDFSMPYNVICLACTAVAFAFGPIHALTTKRLAWKIESNDKSMWQKVKEKFFKK